MIADLLTAPGTLGALALALLTFGFAPGFVLSIVVRLIPDDARRRELQAELYEVPRWERPFWVVEQFELALRIGLVPRVTWAWGRHIWHRSKIESGLQRHREHPTTFYHPDDQLKELVEPGDLVKLMWSVARLPGERMWVEVTHRDGNHLTGTLENWPIFVYKHAGEPVTFHIDDIIDCKLSEEAWAQASDV